MSYRSRNYPCPSHTDSNMTVTLFGYLTRNPLFQPLDMALDLLLKSRDILVPGFAFANRFQNDVIPFFTILPSSGKTTDKTSGTNCLIVSEDFMYLTFPSQESISVDPDASNLMATSRTIASVPLTITMSGSPTSPFLRRDLFSRQIVYLLSLTSLSWISQIIL